MTIRTPDAPPRSAGRPGPSTSAVLRDPDLADEAMMTRRAWWLALLHLLIPGTPQVVAGNRRLGRFALGLWLA
ncbi:MAG: polyisoprenyl-teichoic acid--peptidoglycan teichoic acid transferase, partial [Microbacteriaceae bacterium]|nr:polyisoprenyl-teichoic acid--peptidoglycan teichoic acid transferase [Microbacteriaceae bacterium]